MTCGASKRLIVESVVAGFVSHRVYECESPVGHCGAHACRELIWPQVHLPMVPAPVSLADAREMSKIR